MDEEIPVPRTVLGLDEGGNIKYRELQKLPLRLPTLIFPFRRALFYMAVTAFEDAMISRRPHVVAECLIGEDWDAIRNASATLSECNNSIFYLVSENSSVEDEIP